jgi:glutamine synthetase
MCSIAELDGKAGSADFVKIFFADLNGRIMSLSVNPADLEAIVEEGIGFDGSSIAGFATVDSSDQLLFPDPDSLRIVDLDEGKLGFLIGRIYNDPATRAETDPRAILENVLAEAESEYGFRFTVGPEHEFFLLIEDEFGERSRSDNAGYFDGAPHDKGEDVRNRIVAILKECGIRFEKSHHEVTPSQHEISLEPLDPLQAADRTLLFNYVTRKIAAEFGYGATFMPKPFDDYNRNAFHIHLSMYDLNGGNQFYEQGADHGLSDTARHFIGGVLKYARETSIIMASTFNSYKAYVLEREAPVIKGWGFKNRSSMVRVPYSKNPESTRLELRNPDPCGNVYLQFAAFIAMGLEGVREKIECGPPDSGSTYRKNYALSVLDKRFLPKSMFEALVEAERGEFLKDLLGEHMYHNYMTLKINDWEEHRTHVTPRELSKYLDI